MGEVVQFRRRSAAPVDPFTEMLAQTAGLRAMLERHWSHQEFMLREIQREIAEFARGRKHFDARRQRMAELIASGAAKTLRRAYKMAGKEMK